MANLLSYLNWRGDIPFSSQPFGEVDNLLFSCLSYLDFDDIVPEARESESYQPDPDWVDSSASRESSRRKRRGQGSKAGASAKREEAGPEMKEASKSGESSSVEENAPEPSESAVLDKVLSESAGAGSEAGISSSPASFSANAPSPAGASKTAFAESSGSSHTAQRAARSAPRRVSPSISLRDAAVKYVQDLPNRRTPEISARYNNLMVALQTSSRYAAVRVCDYVCVESTNKPLQFAAVTFILPDGSRYVAFRGTGDEIEDWRQDFMISFTRTAAQEMAIRYLHARMREAPSAEFYVGGHSKGGNLAFYAVMSTSAVAQIRIRKIYSNDGPGICPELRKSGYNSALQKLVRIIPEFSIIGMLFTPEVEPIIVNSDIGGIEQHDPVTWQLNGNGFDTAKSLSPESVNYNHIFDGWIESASMDERASFTKDFFDALKAGGAKTVQDITGNGVNGFGTILISLSGSEKATQVAFRKFFESVVTRIRELKPKDLITSQLSVSGIAVMLLGLLFLILPNAGTHVVGYTLMLIGTLLWMRQITRSAVHPYDDRQKKLIIFLQLLFLCFQVFILSTPAFMTVIENVLIGCCFLVLSILLLRRTIRIHRRSTTLEHGVGYAFSAIFAGVGIYALAFPAQINAFRSITVGAALVIAGVLLIAVGMYREAKKRRE